MIDRAETMNVGFVVYGGIDAVSGGDRYDRKLVEYLESRGDTVEIIDVAQHSYPRSLADSLSPRLRRRLDKPFDVLLQDELCHPSLWYHNRRLTKPTAIVSLVHLLRTPDPDRFFTGVYRDFERWYLDSVDGLICTSDFSEQEATAISAGPSMVAYPGGRRDESVANREIETADRDGPLRVLFVGNLIRRKGAHTLVDALAGVDGDWTATIVGDQSTNLSYAKSVRDRIDRHGLGEHISMPGRIDDESVAAELARADILAVPSRYEGFGMVYLEAMEHGTVPIAGRLGGATELITHDRNGFLVGPDDPDALRDILGGLCSDRDRLAELSEAAYASVQNHPSWADSLARARAFMLHRMTSVE